MLRNLRLLSVNHHTTGVSRLQEVGLRPEAVSSLRAAFNDLGIESVVLATCNRSEVYWRARHAGDDEQVTTMLGHVLSDGEGLSQPVEGAHAARHLFRVCAGLESLIVGEAEILGQVRSAANAVTCDSGVLARIFTAALRAGGVARSGTDIGRGAMSVASVTVNAVADVISLPDASVLIVGAGQTATKVARHVRRLGVGRMMVTNRTRAHADTLARTLDADVVPLEELPSALCAADVVIVAASHPGHLITTSLLAWATSQRGRRPMAVADLSIPSIVEPGEVAGVARIDMTRLDEAIRKNRDRRAADVPRAEAILDRELAALETWARRKAVAPVCMS